MYFDTKSYLKSNRNHTAKHTKNIQDEKKKNDSSINKTYVFLLMSYVLYIIKGGDYLF
jgi:hypothetical protein